MPRSAHVLQTIHCQSCGLLTVVAVLAIGMLVKLAATMQLFHLSR